ncbi:hypothetical protein SL003B_2087 [Polymorphum gilvum SL003B-26A1]|uniref:Uncharacterized protein n=1 Tax=Polymorphum gilvum (strain LMG 25793 / CGMCC 1.9160 / SL003B-26A1) TaxID=991905 RepID=F2IY09_POLGS|nr:hypothetical protein SL003B_2087 [Polymorphum gilvum SL003B-26A1]
MRLGPNEPQSNRKHRKNTRPLRRGTRLSGAFAAAVQRPARSMPTRSARPLSGQAKILGAAAQNGDKYVSMR